MDRFLYAAGAGIVSMIALAALNQVIPGTLSALQVPVFFASAAAGVFAPEIGKRLGA